MQILLASGVLVLSASAQASGWSDGSSFNAPQGTGSSDFNAPASGYARDASGNRTVVDGRFVGHCYYYADGITPGVGTRSGVAESSGFPTNPCEERAGRHGTQAMAIANNVTVVTRGSRNTVVVNATQTNSGNQEVVLNGKINFN